MVDASTLITNAPLSIHMFNWHISSYVYPQNGIEQELTSFLTSYIPITAWLLITIRF